MNTNTSNKSIWDLYQENFLDGLWDFWYTNTLNKPDGYYVDPKLLKGL